MSDSFLDSILSAIPKAPVAPDQPAPIPPAVVVAGETAAPKGSKDSENYGTDFQKRFGAPPAPSAPLIAPLTK